MEPRRHARAASGAARGVGVLLLLGAPLLLSPAPPAVWGAPPSARVSAEPPAGEPGLPRQEPFTVRPFRPFLGERWIGAGIAYGPYRDGQRPGGPSPGREELREDLHLLARRWSLLRLYESGGPSQTILQIIREDGLTMKVMLGVWIAPEERTDADSTRREPLPEAAAANRQEIESAARLAAAYPEIVMAVCVGNETQVFWSDHRVPADLLIGYVREVRERTRVPVTVADDFNFWNKPESRAVAGEVDFLVAHAHPMWNGLTLAAALPWTQEVLADLRARHPDRLVVLGETGWATRRHSEGEQARLIKGEPGEEQQKAFFEALTAWLAPDRFPFFFFEAFDENWKGGTHPDEVEKHWGLYRADRSPKLAVAGER